ncbi:MAG: phenylalanine--tRNA ligase subunit alpha, partial [Lutibacter sp.]|nr:phenylalanine--tRNA ligase subunit alpha [Lutibacter sp.]
MLDKVKELIGEVKAFNGATKDEIETFRIKFLGKKGLL